MKPISKSHKKFLSRCKTKMEDTLTATALPMELVAVNDSFLDSVLAVLFIGGLIAYYLF